MKRIGLLVLALLTVCGLTLSAVPALPAAAQPAPPSAQAVEERASTDEGISFTPLDSPVLCVVGPGSVSEAEDPVVEAGVGFGSAQEAREAANTTAKRTAVARLINLIHTFLLSISIMQINSTAPVLGCQASPWYIPDRGLPIPFFTGILYLLERMNAYEQPTIKRRPISRLRRRL